MSIWAHGAAYEAYVGRWSRAVARAFVPRLGLPDGGLPSEAIDPDAVPPAG